MTSKMDPETWDLAPYAMHAVHSRGRRYPEPDHPYRGLYQRDRERIVHCTAFRRMTGKTQVLIASVNDHHRTRLTHTLEVTQVARTVARRLRLNEDLTEAIALAHDIGHPPFGHSGESALNEALAALGGFDHNLFGLRRVDELEERYPDFPGLNLSFEVREAFVQHSGRWQAPEAAEFAHLGRPLLEAQVVDVVDSIAYDTHDLDDALGLGFITLSDLDHVEIWSQAVRKVQHRYAGLTGAALRTAVIRELLAWLVTDLLEETTQRLSKAAIRCVADVRAYPESLVSFSESVRRMKEELEAFLHKRVYRHPEILRMTGRGREVLLALFAEYLRSPQLLPEKHRRRWVGSESQLAVGSPPENFLGRRRLEQLEIVVSDYIAGMTDRFAQQEYRRLFGAKGDD